MIEKRNIKDLAKEELDRVGALDVNRNKYAGYFVQTLDKDVPFEMSFAIANFTMCSYVGHFHYKIKITEDNLVPMNMIAFILAKSGAKKTSSVLKMENLLAPGLDLIMRYRKDREESLARENDCAARALMPLSNALSTVPGLLQNLNNFKDEGIGLPNLIVDEVATAISTNIDFIPNVEVVAQLFDDGDCKVKVIKDTEAQSQEVKGMGMTALFIGSERGILDDSVILRKFELEFISKLGRRCFFIYPDFEEGGRALYQSIDDFLELEHDDDVVRKSFGDKIKQKSAMIAGKLLRRDSNLLNISKEAERLWKVYRAYCKARAVDIDEEEEVAKLEQEHRHWKMFKLAGAYAVWDNRDELLVQDVKEAIYAAENTANDLTKFLLKAKREIYEMLIDFFMKKKVTELSVHEMVKKGWIKNHNQIANILVNANSKLNGKGTIEQIGSNVVYKAFVFLTEDSPMYACYKVLPPMNLEVHMKNGSTKEEAKKIEKEKRAYHINQGYMYKETTWDKLANLLRKDTAYTPFKFKDGRRGKDNIASPARFIVLDIDDTEDSIDDAANMLGDYRFHMARTSNDENPYKYRIIIPMDIEVDLDAVRWKKFYELVGLHLGLNIDILPQSQIFYGFDGRDVISNNEGELLEASKLVPEIRIEHRVVQLVSEDKRNALWEDREREWHYAYTAKAGTGYHMALFKAMRHAYDLGFSYDSIQELIDDIVETNPSKGLRDNFRKSLTSQMKELYGIDDDRY